MTIETSWVYSWSHLYRRISYFVGCTLCKCQLAFKRSLFVWDQKHRRSCCTSWCQAVLTVPLSCISKRGGEFHGRRMWWTFQRLRSFPRRDRQHYIISRSVDNYFGRHFGNMRSRCSYCWLYHGIKRRNVGLRAGAIFVTGLAGFTHYAGVKFCIMVPSQSKCEKLSSGWIYDHFGLADRYSNTMDTRKWIFWLNLSHKY